MCGGCGVVVGVCVCVSVCVQPYLGLLTYMCSQQPFKNMSSARGQW